MGEFDADLAIFGGEYVPNAQGVPYHSKWKAANKNGDAPKWEKFRDDILAGGNPAPPAMSTKYGKALVAAGKEHLSISRVVGMMVPPVPEPEPPPPPPPPDGDPIPANGIITAGGTYTGTLTDVQLRIDTEQLVTITNSSLTSTGEGDMIRGLGGGFTTRNLILDHCFITGGTGHVMDNEFYDRIEVLNCTIDRTAGFKMILGRAGCTFKFLRNKVTNLQKGPSSTFGGTVVQFNHLVDPAVAEIGWNEIISIHGQHWMEDIFSFINAARVYMHDNYMDGNSRPDNTPGTNGTITLEPNSHDCIIEDNQMVDVATGVYFPSDCPNNICRRNTLIQDGFIGDTGLQMGSGQGGMNLHPPPNGSRMYENVVGYVDMNGNRTDWDVMTGAPGGNAAAEIALNTTLASPITRQMELDERTAWNAKLIANNVTVGAGGPPTVLLEDNFNTTVDPAVWRKRYWFGGGETGGQGADTYYHFPSGEAQAYRDYNVTVVGGILNLTARQEVVTDFLGRQRQYTSGMLQSNGTQGWFPQGFGFTYGLIEARIKVGTNSGPGIWDGFWMCTSEYSDNCQSGEIDILEVVGSDPNRFHMNYHRVSTNTHVGSSYLAPAPLGNDFHIYAVDWRSDHIIWYLDGVERFRYEGANITTVPHYIYLTHVVAEDGGWAGNVGPGTVFPNTMQVDWVRVSP